MIGMKEFLRILRENKDWVCETVEADVDAQYTKTLEKYKNNIGNRALLVENKEIRIVNIVNTTDHIVIYNYPVYGDNQDHELVQQFILGSVSASSLLCGSSTLEVI